MINAYVPIVEIPDENGGTVKMKVDAFDEEPVYHIGTTMNVLCNRTESERCIENTFMEIWGGAIEGYLLGLAFLLPLLYYRLIYLKRQAAKEARQEPNAV